MVPLVEASPKGYTLKGKLQLPGAVTKPGATTPVIAGGHLYLRDDDRLFCYDVSDGAKPAKKACAAKPAPKGPEPSGPGSPRAKEPGEPDAVFVPTPQDVVERMVEEANIRPDELVWDWAAAMAGSWVTVAGHGPPGSRLRHRPGVRPPLCGGRTSRGTR